MRQRVQLPVQPVGTTSGLKQRGHRTALGSLTFRPHVGQAIPEVLVDMVIITTFLRRSQRVLLRAIWAT